MKYSFLIPYCNRAIHFSLCSVAYTHHYHNRQDYEIIIIEDRKNFDDPQNHSDLLNIIQDSKLPIKHIISEYNYFNPAYSFNLGAQHAQGEYFIITNPEIFHRVNILNGLDIEFEKNPTAYIVCSCQNVHALTNSISHITEMIVAESCWYQHSQHSNRLLHFCSAISRDNYKKIDGFSEEYNEGIAYEDDDFRHKILSEKTIEIVVQDDLCTFHLDHDRSYLHQNPELMGKNRAIFHEKWGPAKYTRD